MKNSAFLSMLLAAALTTACGGGRQQDQAATGGGSAAVGTSGAAATDVSSGDRDFVQEITASNMAEIELAKLALQQASDSNVKKFAQMMVDDHSKAGTRLQALASQHRIDMAAHSAAANDDHAKELAGKRGAEFDREYADTMVEAHEEFVNALEARIDKENLTKWKENHTNPATGKQPKGEALTVVAEQSDHPVTQALNQWAAETYPVAFAHLQAARDLQKGTQRRGTTP